MVLGVSHQIKKTSQASKLSKEQNHQVIYHIYIIVSWIWGGWGIFMGMCVGNFRIITEKDTI